MSYKERQLVIIKSIINSEWTNKSIIVHNKITDIRHLIRLVNKSKFDILDDIAVEVETISGISLGCEEEFIPDLQKIELDQYVIHMKNFVENYKLQ